MRELTCIYKQSARVLARVSKEAMKNVQMKLDLVNDTAEILEREYIQVAPNQITITFHYKT